MSPRWLWLLGTLALLALWQGRHRPIPHLPGELVAAVPLQEPLDSTPADLHKGNITIKPVAKLSPSSQILSRAD